MSKVYVQVLKNYVEVEFGQKIQSKPDCISLSQELKRVTGTTVSYNTLRRVFNVLPNEHSKPRVATLNVLSKYLGYDNFSAFMLFPKDQSNSLRIHERLNSMNPSFEVWYATDMLQKVKDSNDIVGIAFILRTLILEFRYTELLEIMKSNAFEQFSMQSREVLASLAELTGNYFIQINNKDFVKQLITQTYYVKTILSFFVANGDLAGSYGNHIQLVNQHTQVKEQILFTSSLLAWNAAIYNNKEVFNHHLNRIQAIADPKGYFAVLQGRLDLIQCLSTAKEFKLNHSLLNQLINKVQGNDEYILLYSFDITSYLLVTLQLELLQIWVNKFGRKLRKTFRWSDFSIVQQHLIVICAINLFSNEKAQYRLNRSKINKNLWSRATYSLKEKMLVVLDQLELHYFSGGPMPTPSNYLNH